MRFRELVSEAISISHLEKPIEQAINDGVKQAVGILYDLKGEYPDAEDEFDNGSSSQLRKIFFAALNLKESDWYIGSYISRNVKKVLNDELGEVVNNIEFIQLSDNVGGQASGNDIDINEKSIKLISEKVIDSLVNIVIDNYDESQRSAGLWFIINLIKRGERDYDRYIIPRFDREASTMASTIVHEAVHVIQHDTQNKRGFLNHEYRSYLDKKKNEFVNLHNKRYSDSSQLSADDESRYFKLYMASPQEMASFSHEVAIQMINDYNLPEADSIEDFENAFGVIDADRIIDYVSDKVGAYFRKPENKREYAVFKRYVKLVYQELQAYISKRKKYLSKTSI